MNISRKILRAVILNEIKRVLSNDHLIEGLIDRLAAADSDEIDSIIQSAKDQAGEEYLDSIIRSSVNVEGFAENISEIDDEALIAVFGKVRGSLTGSAIKILKDSLITAKPSLKGKLS